MLGNAAIVEAVAQRLAKVELPIVVDPVLISTTGSLLLAEGGLDAYRDSLLRVATVVTPNRDELAALLGRPAASIATTDDLRLAAMDLSQMTASVVVAKGGHVKPVDGRVVDLVVNQGTVTSLPQPFIDTPNDHGTGCSFAASLAAYLGRGFSLDDAINEAQRFVHLAIAGASSWRLGSGRGPINHHGWATTLPVSQAG